jgi:hypothetical protein
MHHPLKFACSGAALLLAMVVLFSGFPFTVTAQATTSQLSADEYSLKAAFLYNLAKFLDWPPEKFKRDDSPLIIGVDGDGAFERFSAVVRDKIIAKHRVEVRRIKNDSDIQDCHILFFTRSPSEPIEVRLNLANKSAVLTVGETDKFLESGGMIRFYLEGDNLRLEIDRVSVRQAALGINANALSTLINKGIVKLRKL